MGLDMTDRDKSTRQATIHDRPQNGLATPKEPNLEQTQHRRDRLGEELRPLAKLVSENPTIMKRFYQARGSDNEDLGRAVVDEIINYARSVDPAISYVEGATLVLLLEEMFPRE